ncbi:hypothetical protein ACFV4P_16815 [Kitasatospora sp. NPDC059795]
MGWTGYKHLDNDFDQQRQEQVYEVFGNHVPEPEDWSDQIAKADSERRA